MSATIQTYHLEHGNDVVDQDTSQEICVKKSYVGSYESMVAWRGQYLEWLDFASLHGSYRIALTSMSRTWNLSIFFSDIRDAVIFKLIWG